MLAIVIPYYKLTFFRETLESLAAQTDQRFHVYIGNDASPEDPKELLREFEDQFSFIYKKFEDNLGGKSLTQHWNRCIAMIQEEEWFMILGDDDTLDENVVSQFYKYYDIFCLENNVVRYSTQLIDALGIPISKIYVQPQFEKPLDSYFRKRDGNNRSSISEHIFRKAQYIKYGIKEYPLAWCADDMAVIDFSNNKYIFSINEAIVSVRMSTLNISSRKSDFELKGKAIMLHTKDLLLNHAKKMTTIHRRFLIKNYEHQIFGKKNVSFNEIIVVNYLFFKYMPIENIYYIFKASVHKILKFY